MPPPPASSPQLQVTPSGAATIKDIAHKLGVSHSTVSRALSGHGRVSAELRAKIQEAASTLGYVVHSGARAMRAAQSTLIGFVVPDVGNDFYSSAAKHLADQCAAHGYQLVLAVSEEDPSRELRQVEALREARAAAIVITPTAQISDRTVALLKGTRAIQFVRQHPSLSIGSIAVDDMAGTRLATQHLLDLGHRDIAFIGGSTALSTGRARLEGYRSALSAHGVAPDDRLILMGRPRPEFGTSAVQRLLSGPLLPSALVLGSSRLIVGVLRALQQAGLRTPDDLSLIGYGDTDWFAAWQPGIATIGFSVEEMIRLAASHLFDEGDSAHLAGPAANFRTEPHLIIRGSTARFARAPSPSASQQEAKQVSADEGHPSARS